jgi:hypothetical protein
MPDARTSDAPATVDAPMVDAPADAPADASVPDSAADASLPDGAPVDAAPDEIVSITYDVPAGDDVRMCRRVDVAATRRFATVVATLPPGAVELVLAVDPTPDSPGIAPCSGIDADWHVLFATGQQATVSYPVGAGLGVTASEQIVLMVHALNVTDTPLTSSAALHGPLLAAAGPTSDTLLAGPASFTVPTGTIVVQATCTAAGAMTIFAVGSATRALGTHVRVAVTTGAGNAVVYDRDVALGDHPLDPLAPIDLVSGDLIDVRCTYVNPGPTVMSGPNLTDEQCASYMFRAAGSLDGQPLCSS